MDQVLLAALLIGWAAVLLPSALRSRRSSDPIATVGGFTEAMAVLRGRPSGREIMVPDQAERFGGERVHRPVSGAAPRAAGVDRETARRRVLARRRATFLRLLAATGLTLVLAMVVGGVLWPLFSVTALALLGYVAVLRHHKLERDEARSVVRSMRPPPEREYRREEVRQPVAVGAEPGGAWRPVESDGWHEQSSVRIRRWEH